MNEGFSSPQRLKILIYGSEDVLKGKAAARESAADFMTRKRNVTYRALNIVGDPFNERR
jgi:hypothetical protein